MVISKDHAYRGTPGGHSQYILAHKGGGVLGTGTTPKRAVLGTGTTPKRVYLARARVEKEGS